LLALTLLTAAFTATGISITNSAFAQKNDDDDDHGSQDRDRDRIRDPSTHDSDDDDATPAQDRDRDRDSSANRNPSQERRQDRLHTYLNATAEEKHLRHLELGQPETEPYLANTNYSLTAEGTATLITNSTTEQDTSISIDLATWSSTSLLVRMDVMGGTVSLDDEDVEIHSGQAWYFINSKALRVSGYSEADDGAVRTFIIWATSSDALPAEQSDPAMQIQTVEVRSHFDRLWLLDMDGEVLLS
jgi:hypothetical protein